MSDELRLLGLDIETTGSALDLDVRLIQIGVCDLKTGALFRSYVGWPEGSFRMVPEASAVHHISAERILSAPGWLFVEMELFRWLETLGVGPKRGIPIGFNVAGFDMPFVRRDLPLAASRFSYRSIDLNAICFALGIAHETPWTRFKEEAKAYAREACAVNPTTASLLPHDAGYDAAEAVEAFRYLTRCAIAGKGMP